MKYAYYLFSLLFLSTCYNPYIRINESNKTLNRTSRCTDPVLKDVANRTAGIYILSNFWGGEQGEIQEDKINFIRMDMKQQFPEEWITSFEQGLLLTIPTEAIFYDRNARQLIDIGEQRLTQLSALLAKYPETSFIIEGHHVGEDFRKKNYKIALEQIKKVGRFLRKRNIDKERFEVISYGCQQRIAAEGSKNNRIEIAIGYVQ